MAIITRVDLDENKWFLEDKSSNSRYHIVPFQNYSELPYYKHVVETQKMEFVFSLNNTKQNIYELGNFSARPPNHKKIGVNFGLLQTDLNISLLKYEKRTSAFEEAFPLLVNFLTFTSENKSEKLHIENNVEFKTFKDTQLDSIKSHLSGGVYLELLIAKKLCEALGVDSVSAVRDEIKKRQSEGTELPEETDIIPFFDYEEWMEESQKKYFMKRLEELKCRWLIESAPLDKIYREIFQSYLSGGKQIEASEVFIEKHLELFRPYLSAAV